MGKASSVLVTGGGGFIGSHVVDALLKRNIRVGVLDDFSTGQTSNLVQHAALDLQLHKGDIRDEEFVRRAVRGYDAVIHQAALVSVTRSVEDPRLTNSVNVDGTVNLLSAARDANIRRFIYASSSSVYGETQTQPKTETMNTLPISPYAVSKLAAENYCRVFARVYGMETICLRYFNVYGPRQKSGPYSGVIPTFIKRVMNGEPLIIFGDGKQTRDFTYVEDVVSANLLGLEADVSQGRESVFNVASGRPVTLNELASMVTRLMGKPDLGTEHVAPRMGDIRDSYSDISRAKRVLGYSPSFTLEEGLPRVIEYFVAHS